VRRTSPKPSWHNKMKLQVKRIYDPAQEQDGYRVLVDRLWPRGISKEKAQLDDWAKDLAPTAELRQSFHHEELTFAQFEKAYLKELNESEEALAHRKALQARLKEQPVTLLTANKDMGHSQVTSLMEWLQKKD
jgi:uncharacterized protein YeaO (DUF488 family)